MPAYAYKLCFNCVEYLVYHSLNVISRKKINKSTFVTIILFDLKKKIVRRIVDYFRDVGNTGMLLKKSERF